MLGGLMSLIAYGARDFIPYGRPTYYSYFEDEYYDKIYKEIFKPLKEYYINNYNIKQKYKLSHYFNYCIDINKYVSYLDKIANLKTERQNIILNIKDYNMYIKELKYDYTINSVYKKIKLIKQLKQRYRIVSKELRENKYKFSEFKEYNKQFIDNLRTKCNNKYDAIVDKITEDEIKTAYLEYRDNMITELKNDDIEEYNEFINELGKYEKMRTEQYLFEDNSYLYM
jgi:hypothetical protein